MQKNKKHSRKNPLIEKMEKRISQWSGAKKNELRVKNWDDCDIIEIHALLFGQH